MFAAHAVRTDERYTSQPTDPAHVVADPSNKVRHFVAVLILAAAAFKTLGKSVLKGAEDSNTAFSK